MTLCKVFLLLESPPEKSLNVLFETLKGHFDPKPIVVAKRFRFYQCSQRTEKSIVDFITDIRHLSISCNFGEFLDQALHDHFVCGVRSKSLQKKLLTKIIRKQPRFAY